MTPDPESIAGLDIAPEDLEELFRNEPDAEHVAEVAATFKNTIGDRDIRPDLPEAPDPFFYAHVCLALLPAVRAYHRERGVPDPISWASLAALGNNLARHRRIYGAGGLDGPQWAVRVFRGLVFRIERLVFERTRLGPEVAEATGANENDDALGIHIPPGGPLDPAGCDAAFTAAVEFFTRHFPEDRLGRAHCRSWLLDPQLAEYLPPTSNLARFAGRFQLVPAGYTDDRSIVRWVFEVADPSDLDALEPVTTLERAIVEHLRAGRHWRIELGRLDLR
ncbi:MAG TPA: acyltransferase domain-containing protein [Mycobacteriales bacterium]|nr:acyltransferase domain-containing protein [Mycobacteriales bacterium]